MDVLARTSTVNLALVGPALHDVREVMVEGASGIKALAEPGDRPRWEVSLGELARAVLNAVNAAAGSGGLGAAVQAALGAFGGARADGGPVLAGGAYLVGERGPEVFRPATGGSVEPAAGGGVTVNVTVDGGAPALLRSEAQIAQMLARAVSLGARRI
jgi:phage-related minor tail protein